MSEVVTQNQYKWIEQAALLSDGKMVRNEFARIDDSEAINKWRCRFNNTDIFYSICIYSSPANSVDFLCPKFFDIDCAENLPVTRESALILCEMIMSKIGVPPNCIEIYFSGNKGFHVIVPTVVFGAFSTPYALLLNRKMAEKAEEAGARFIDKGIYTSRRLFRYPNSKNSKSGLYKIPLPYEELRDMDINGILKLAENPRPEDSYAFPVMCKSAVSWNHDAIERVQKGISNHHSSDKNTSTKFKKGWRRPPCVKNIQEAIFPDGIRHHAYLSLARFYSWINMHPDEIFELIQIIDNKNPIRDPGSIERAIRSACEHPGFAGCDDEVFKKYCCKDICFYAKLKGQNRSSLNE